MRGRRGGLAGPAALDGVPDAALKSALETADPAEVLSGCLHAWSSDFLRSLRMHEESAGSAQAAPAAAEAVRQLRSAARRIGSALLTYRPLVDAGWADELSSELRRLSGTLAREYRCAARQARLLGALHRLAVEGVGGDRAAALLERQHTLARSRAHSAALEALVSSRFHAVADAVTVLAYEVPLAPAGTGGAAGVTGAAGAAGAAAGARGRERFGGSAAEVLVPLAEGARERLVHAVEALPAAGRAVAGASLGTAAGRRERGGGRLGRERHEGRDGPEVPRGSDVQSRQDAAWFEVRILLRHHRYAQEVLYAAVAPPGGAAPGGRPSGSGSGSGCEHEGATGEGVDPRLAAASAALDRHRDAVEAADAAAAAARTPRIAPATAYALGVLHAGQRQEAEAARREFSVLWEQFTTGERQEAAPQAL